MVNMILLGNFGYINITANIGLKLCTADKKCISLSQTISGRGYMLSDKVFLNIEVYCMSVFKKANMTANIKMLV
jgi:hypothetical protein